MSIRTVVRSSRALRTWRVLRVASRAAIAVALAAAAAPSFAQSAGGTAARPSAAERLDALDKRITRLEDLNAIERLQRTYGYFVDKSQWRQLAELFSDDATLEIGGKGLFTGKPRV